MKLLEYLDQGEEVQEARQVNTELGLTAKEANKRLKDNGKNVLREAEKVHPFQIFVCQFKDFLTMVLLLSTAITVFMGEYTEAFTIGMIVLLNGVMGFVQEYKTEKTLDALRKMAAPMAHVYRDGILMQIPGEDLVAGDVLSIEAGDRVPADAVLMKAIALSADESVLTGESVATTKSVGKTEEIENILHQSNLIYMGTTISTGRGEARIISTGMDTQMGKIAGMISEIREEPTPLQKRLDELGKIIAIGCLIICAIVAIAGFLRGEPLVNMLLTGVSLAVAAVPEGLPAIVTISLALAVSRMIKRKSLIRKLHAVETLGCTDVICSDKTGTLTENKMTVQRIYLFNEEIKVTGTGYQKLGKFIIDDKTVNPEGSSAGKRMLEISTLCNNAVINAEKGSRGFLKESGTYSIVGDPTEAALLVMAAKTGVTQRFLADEYKRIDEIPFDSKRKIMSVVVVDRQGQRLIMTKGGCDVLLEKCSGMLCGDKILPITGILRNKIEEANTRMAEKGLRVLGMGYRLMTSGEGMAHAERGLIFAGLVGMMDPPRKEAKTAVLTCRKAGIKTVMITGDHKLTACAIAKQVGIFHENDGVLTGKELDLLSEEELTRQIENVTVFARVSPHHKLKIVRAFRQKGHITAMTGDGVNDAPAVKEADIGVSMGISGTDVTKEASDVILLDDNFATLVTAVEEGRTIYGNIRKFIRYLLSCNIGEVLTMFLGILMGLPVILLPIHILLVNLVTDGLPAIALGLDPADKNSMKKLPRRASDSIFSDGLLSTIVFRGCLIGLTTLAVFVHFLTSFGSIEMARSAAFLTLVMTQLIHVFECKSEEKTIFTIHFWNNWKLVAAVILSAAIIMAAIFWPPMQKIFQTVALNGSQLATVGCYLAVAPILSVVVQKFFRNKKEK
ncbi:MAG: cation-translocating P-type ATPase [Oscillospiraceae bacterium]